MEEKFTNPTELVEWIAVSLGIIKAFENRGYGLYPLGRAPMMFTDIEMIMEFVQYGRTEDVLEIGVRHLPLPLLKDSTDTFQMKKAIEEMAMQLRGPFFANIAINAKREISKVSTHLIDTVVLEPPFLNLVTDVRFSQVTTENVIELHLSAAATSIEKQLQMSLRSVYVRGGTKKPNALL